MIELAFEIAVIAVFVSLGYEVNEVEYFQGYSAYIYPEDKILYITPIRSGIDDYGLNWYEHEFLHHHHRPRW